MVLKLDGLLARPELVGGVAHVGGAVVAPDPVDDQQVAIASLLRCHSATQRNHLYKKKGLYTTTKTAQV